MQTSVTVVMLLHDTATEAEYAALEKTHICCTVADVSDNRGVPLPHFHVEGS